MRVEDAIPVSITPQVVAEGQRMATVLHAFGRV
jgi:hypothetical protein